MMSSYIAANGECFESFAALVEVTSLHRPDTAWRFVDVRGHEHRWYIGETPAESYTPGAVYTTPTLIWIKDGEEYWEDDDEPHDVGHLECRQCGEHVTPGYRADDTPQYMAGLRHYRINGESVSPDEFTRRLRATQEGQK